MYKVDLEQKKLIRLKPTDFTSQNILERFDIQEWIEGTSEILGDQLLIISKELALPSGIRLDLLAIDKQARLVVIELKRDSSGSEVEWQAIKYTSYCANFRPDEIYAYYATYLKADEDEAQQLIEEFIDEEPDVLNAAQRMIFCARVFHSDVISAVMWLREFGIDIQCVRLEPYLDTDQQLFLKPEIIIPLPEARDYIQRRETKQKDANRSRPSSFSLEKSNLDQEELAEQIRKTLRRKSDLTPRIVAFLRVLISEQRAFRRNEIKERLFGEDIGETLGQSGRYLSNISQFLTKKSNPHLRQVIDFDTSGGLGETKKNYRVVDEYRPLLSRLLQELDETDDQANQTAGQA